MTRRPLALAALAAATMASALAAPAPADAATHVTPCTGRAKATCHVEYVGHPGVIGSVFVRNGQAEPMNLDCVFGRAPAAPCATARIPHGGFREVVYSGNNSQVWHQPPNWPTGNLSVGSIDNTQFWTREYVSCQQGPAAGENYATLTLTAGGGSSWKSESFTAPCDGRSYEVSEETLGKFVGNSSNKRVAYQLKFNGPKSYRFSIFSYPATTSFEGSTGPKPLTMTKVTA